MIAPKENAIVGAVPVVMNKFVVSPNHPWTVRMMRTITSRILSLWIELEVLDSGGSFAPPLSGPELFAKSSFLSFTHLFQAGNFVVP